MTRRFALRHPRAAGAVLSALGALLGAMLVLGLVVTASGCGQRQAIANATAVASVTTSRGAIAWFEAEWQEAEDAAAEAHGSVADVCDAVSEAHRVAQRVECAAVALADLAIAGQALIDASADDAEWTAYLAAIPPLIVAVRVAFEAADYEPPAGVTQALGVLAGLLSLVAPGDSPPLTCTVTDGPAECLELADPDAGAERP